MTVPSTRPEPIRIAAPPFLWDRQLHPAIDAIVAQSDAPPRALLIGNAGSGKSTTLRHLRTLLAERERGVQVVQSDAASIAQIPHDEVLLVDDLHLLDAGQIMILHARSADPDAALIVASRSWPSSEMHRSIARMLEHVLPAIVLGHVGRADVLQHLDGHRRALPERCLQHILEVTGGISWLVSEALIQHDERDCAADDGHTELHSALEERISHRLEMIDSDLRQMIERACIAPRGSSSPRSEPLSEPLSGQVSGDAAPRGHAEGLLLRNGQPVPLVRSAVCAMLSAQRLAELRHDEDVDPAALTGRRAQDAWARGDLDAAIAIADDAPANAQTVDGDRLTDIAAGVWAARAMMAQADATYRTRPPVCMESATIAMIAAIGVGSVGGSIGASIGAPIDGSIGERMIEARTAVGQTHAASAPSTLSVSMQLLRRGLTASITTDWSESVLADLVRAAELYTSSRVSGAIAELPAAIASVVALNMGGVLAAQAVLDDAIRNEHGGRWALPRLLLWRAWVAVQRARATEAREALARAHELAPHLSPRDALLARAVEVAIARRYEDASGLEAAWRRARGSMLRTDIDLYLLHPLAELINSAARVGDAERIRPHFAHALKITTHLGEPPLWIAHLRWAGIQHGIFLGRPGHVAPHAKALVAASADNHVAAIMAKAGRVWTSVLGGTVDAVAVEAAADGLASVGLKWDGARLAGHGAARTDDRRVSARLLACARELHPTDGTRKSVIAETGAAADSARIRPEDILSDREIEVARLVLQGKTYAEIGEAIFISPRTAEHHIAHIRQRLGATSRSDVISKLRQLIDETVPAGRDSSAVEAPPSLSLRISG